VSPEHHDLAVELVRRDADACVLAVSGELPQRSAGLITAALSKSLADTGRVLVDVSRLRLAWPPAVQVFPSVLSGMGGWPGVRLVLFGADARLARLLAALRVTSKVPVAPNEATARRLLERRPRVVARHIDLEQARSSPPRARDYVRAACLDWHLDEMRHDAVIVASELVENAVLHAGTACRLVLRYNARGLTVAVRDHRPGGLPPPRPVDSGTLRLHGLFLVAAVSREWGVTSTKDGKIVWAFLPVGDAANYSHTIWKAAHDAVRAVLGHGVNSPAAATAVRRITARLAEQHGASAVRDMADELALHLTEASSAAELINERNIHDGLDSWVHAHQTPDFADPGTS